MECGLTQPAYLPTALPCLLPGRQTFWWAYQRAREAGGKLVMRNDDLDYSRVKPEFVQGFIDDLR